jgi:hypothetical protein
MRAILMIILIAISLNSLAPPLVYEREYSYIEEYQKMLHKIAVLNAIITVESGTLGSKAFNKKENAAGILQIRPIYVKEVNKYSDIHFTLADRFDVEKSIQMFFILNDTLNPEYDLSRTSHCHNAGYYNITKRYHHTLTYRKKVQNEYEMDISSPYTDISFELLWSDQSAEVDDGLRRR